MLLNLFKLLTHTLLMGSLFVMASLKIYSQDAASIKYIIKGLSSSLTTCVASHLENMPPSPSLQETMLKAQAAIQSLLKVHGYFHADIQVTAHQTPTGDQITYTISKGPQLAITNIAIQFIGEGQTNANLERERSKLMLTQGSPMTTENYQTIKQSLSTLLTAEGYIKAVWKTHTIAIDLERYTATITILIDTGPCHTIGSIQFSKHQFHDALLKSYLSFQEGSPYQLHNILESQHALEKSGYFRKVLIEADTKYSSQKLPVHINLIPAPKYYTLATLGIRTDLKPHIKIEGLIRRLNHAGHQLAGIAKLSNNYLDALSVYTMAGQFPAYQKHQLKLHCTNRYEEWGNNSSDNNASTTKSAVLSYVYTQFYRWWELSSNVALHYERFKLLDHEKDNLYRGLIVGVLFHNTPEHWSLKAIYNYHVNCKVQLGIRPFSSLNLLRVESNNVYSLRLKQIPLSYLIIRGQTGYCMGPSPNTVPYSLRFQAGGDNYPRGHTPYLLGSHFLGGGIEMRIRLAGLFYLNPYLDLTYDSYCNNPIRGSTGIGLCLWYPRIGNIEVSGVVRINADSKEGRYGITVKLSTHP